MRQGSERLDGGFLRRNARPSMIDSGGGEVAKRNNSSGAMGGKL